MHRQEAEAFMKLIVPSVFAEIEAKRKKFKPPLYREEFDPAAKTNQYGDIGFNQERAIEEATTVVVQYCTKVKIQKHMIF